MEQEKRQKEITRHGLIRVGLWLGGGWLLLVLCAWGCSPTWNRTGTAGSWRER